MVKIRNRAKLRIGYVLIILVVSAVALGGAYYLGDLYLRILAEGNLPRGMKVNAGVYEEVTVPEEQQLLMLTPVPVYFLQAGVFSTAEGAAEAAKPFRELGYEPYITESAPFRLWIGIYRQRGDAEPVKLLLKDKGYGSFTGSLVMNGSNLHFNKGNERFMREVAPVLQAYTDWLKENLQLFGGGRVDQLDWSSFAKQDIVCEKVYKNILELGSDTVSNNNVMNGKLAALHTSANQYHAQLEAFKKEKTQQSFALLQYQLLSYIDKYRLIWQEIDNICKT